MLAIFQVIMNKNLRDLINEEKIAIFVNNILESSLDPVK